MIEQRLENCEKELAAIRKELQAKPEDRFVPVLGEDYWYISDTGVEWKTEWADDPSDIFRLAIGNCHRTKEEARRYKASLYLKTPTGPMPKDGYGLMMYFTNGSVGLWGPNLHVTAIRGWILGEVCVKGYEQELEAKWRRYGWSVIGEPEPEGWES